MDLDARIQYAPRVALVPALSPRLAVIADWLPRGCVFADIGTDHALLPTAVTARDPTARAIAVDRRAGPLTAARETVARWGLATRVDLRLAEGLSAIAPGEVDTVTIAGMGGERIIEIFASAPEVSAALTRVILQPNTDAPRVRRWLTQAGWTLVDERAPTVRGRVYVTMHARTSALVPAETSAVGPPGRWSEDAWLLGPHLLRRGGDELATLVRLELTRCRRAARARARAGVAPDEPLAQRAARLEARLQALIGASAGEP